MKGQETVSDIQMSFIFLSFLVGSAIVNIPSPLLNSAGNAAWLSLLIAFGISILLLTGILFLNRQYKGLTFIDYVRKTFGKGVMFLFAIPFVIMLFLMLTNIVFDVGLFLQNTIMRTTPMYIFHLLIMLVASLTVYEGIEVMGRMFTMLILFVVSVFFIFLLLIIPQLHPEYLLPLFPDGLKPVFHGGYLAWGFPYAEVILFAVLLPFARRKEEGTLEKGMFIAILFNGFLLLMAILVSIMILGPAGVDIKYSLFYIATLIDIQDVLTRIEAVIAMSWIIGSYMKATVVLFVVNFIISQILNLKDDRILLFPISLLSFLLSVTIYNHELEFVESVSNVWPLLITVVGVLPILLIIIFTFLKTKFRKQTQL
ncbi:GerAB/ArcD/ProY family transporter [Alkalihalobacillus deserti]|uniref:GerAB/ArcD/ProY family transporter n=1 Tax=Alkalihalobacillus deserti TaxID=2879466 RepID=UPI001D1586E5|nr:endospore germination permease [Alkalihalobacillus deserti]